MYTDHDAPWLKSYGSVPFHLDYPDCSMSDAVLSAAAKYPNDTALSFQGRSISYSHLTRMINLCANAFAAMGVKPGDRVTLCMPNVPQAVYCLYALNRIGAAASMIHPLSAVGEIVFFLKSTGSRTVVTLDRFCPKLLEVRQQCRVDRIIMTSVSHELSRPKAAAYRLTEERKYALPKDSGIVLWRNFLKKGRSVRAAGHKPDTAVILFSGGTTGTTKAIQLTDLNLNALAYQTAAMANQGDIHGSSMLAAMPIFHGFGLGVCVHTMLVHGGYSILVPRFDAKSYAELISREKPDFIAGVPTLFEAICRNPYLSGVRLDFLKGVFSGGDSLSPDLKRRFDEFLADHGCSVRIREGYGTTECVTASCLTPSHREKEGSIGLPYPDTYYCICAVGTTDELPHGTEGEICLRGPTVMKGYLNRPEENARTLRIHRDGHTWLHTGDLGIMDEDGFIYFRQRIKRMIITSGYNVYPSQLEGIIDAHEAVKASCVIGVKDEYKMQKVKAYVVLNEGFEPSDTTKAQILDYCRRHIAKYAMPYDIEFRQSLPRTLVGKIAYRVLEEENG